MRQTLYEFCCRNNKDLLLLQWDTEKNAPLTPRQVTAGTMRKVWWRCVLGHFWRAAVFPRVQKGVGCPYCAGRKVLPGFNDLASKAPAVAAQWHPALNGSLTPEMVTVSSHRRVWWQCPPGPCMEGSGLLPHGGAEMRLSGLRRLPGRGPQGPV